MGSQRKLHGGNIPGSLSGGIVHNSMEVTKTTFSVSTLDSGLACARRGLRRKGLSFSRFGLGNASWMMGWGTLKLLGAGRLPTQPLLDDNGPVLFPCQVASGVGLYYELFYEFV